MGGKYGPPPRNSLARILKIFMRGRPALEKIAKKNPRFAKRLAFALDFPDAVLNEPMPPPKPAQELKYKNWLAPGYLKKGYGGSKEWPFDFNHAVEQEGYRRGIVRAIANKVDYNWEWRREAALDMKLVLEIVEELGSQSTPVSKRWLPWNWNK